MNADDIKSKTYRRLSAFILVPFLFALVSAVYADDNHLLFEKAQNYFKGKKYKEAKKALNDLVAKASPLEDYIPKARLLLANLQEDFSISIAQFQSLATEYSHRPEGEEAQKNLGARYYLADKYSEAAHSYEDFLKDYPKSLYVSEARYWFASSLLALDRNQEAIDHYKQVLDKAPDSPWAPKALLGIGNAYFKLGKYNDARDQYLRILDQYHYYDELNLVYLKLGQTYEQEQKAKEAHAAYMTLIEKYPKSFEVTDARARMGALEKQDPSLAPKVVQEEPTAVPTVFVVQAEATPTPVVEVEPTPVPIEASKPKPFHVQIGVYSKQANVDKARKQVKKAGRASFVVVVKAPDVPYTYYKVRVGSFENRAQAEKLAKELSKKTKEKAIVVQD